MEMTAELQAPAILSPVKEPQYPLHKAGWAPEIVCVQPVT